MMLVNSFSENTAIQYSKTSLKDVIPASSTPSTSVIAIWEGSSGYWAYVLNLIF